MNGLAGWIDFGADPTAHNPLDAMTGRLGSGQGHTERRVTGRGFATAAIGKAATIGRHESDGDAAIVLGEARLGDIASADGVAERLLEEYRQRGPQALAKLRGRFAVVLIRERTREALLAVDRVAVFPLGYAVIPGGLVFGSRADAVTAHPAVGREIDLQQIFNYLYLHFIPSPASIFARHVRLTPGSYVRLCDGKFESGRYWQPDYSRERERLPIKPLIEEFRALLRESVARQLNGEPVGAFLSGGTDSSTVSGLLGEITGEPARTFSIGFEAEGYDEMAYARLAARHFGTRHHEYYVTHDDVTRAIPEIARIHAEPFGNSSAVPTYYCAKLAREDGVSRLLAGDGGDELFGGNARYATQALFARYTSLPGFSRALLEPIVFHFPGGDYILPMRKLRSYITQAKRPMPARMESHNLLEHLGIERVFHAEFLAQVDTRAPLRHLAEVYNGARAETILNRMLALDHKLTLADNDLPKVGRSCDLAGVDVAYPMLTDEMMAFAERLPVSLKLKGMRLRYFFKEALRDFLPPEILTKTKHGFGLPYGTWLLSHRALRELSYDSLADFGKRGIVRPEFIRELTDELVSVHPAYYGTLVWVLVMLEQWMQRHVDAQSHAC